MGISWEETEVYLWYPFPGNAFIRACVCVCVCVCVWVGGIAWEEREGCETEEEEPYRRGTLFLLLFLGQPRSHKCIHSALHQRVVITEACGHLITAMQG